MKKTIFEIWHDYNIDRLDPYERDYEFLENFQDKSFSKENDILEEVKQQKFNLLKDFPVDYANISDVLTNPQI